MKYNGDTLFENLKGVTAIMKKLLTLMLLVSLCLSGCALGNNVSEEENAMTISDFQKDTSLTSIPESNGKLLNLDLESVIAYGRLRALFGEPNYETQNSEDAYSYIWGMAAQISSPVKARMGASRRTMASSTIKIALWALRRARESAPSQYRRSLMMSR